MIDEDGLTPEQQLRFERLLALSDLLIKVASREGISRDHYFVTRERFTRVMEAGMGELGYPPLFVRAIMGPPK